MGSYTFNSWKYYVRSGDDMTPDTLNLFNYGTTPATVTEDGDADNSLDPGENDLTNDWGAPGTVTYYGTLFHGGRTFTVFQDDYNYFLGIPEMNVAEADFPTNWDFSNVTEVSTPACFGAGALIRSETGEVAVETLAIGDKLVTAPGHSSIVRWIGRQTVCRLLSGAKMQPIRIRAGAFGNGLPHSDLTVTADHGMIVDGLVINASALVNGTTIDWVPMAELPDRVTYYHIETENHDVILANGAPAETFIDYAGRQAFDNYGEYVELYGAERIIPEMDRPRISAQRLLPDAIRARLGIVDEVIDWDAPLSA